MTSKEIARKVLADQDRPCLFGVMGPCFHPKCLDFFYEIIKNEYP